MWGNRTPVLPWRRCKHDPPLVWLVGKQNEELILKEVRCDKCGAQLRIFKARPVTEGGGVTWMRSVPAAPRDEDRRPPPPPPPS